MDPRTSEVGRRTFSVVRTLGEGAFGSVFLADMVSAGGFRKRVALKLLNSSWDPESDAGRRLRDEARLLGRLQHRNIVRVDDLLQLGGRWGLLMEYIPGLDVETLFTRAKENGVELPPRAMLQICAAIAAALDGAFGAVGDDGRPLLVVHRDIKPSNVRLSETGEVKVLDFGVARAEFAGREAKTERVRYGSLGYMAPERILGEPEVAAGDVYSLGAMLYELLTLESFGRAELAPDKQAAQVEAAVARVRERVGDEIAELVKRSLDYDVENRPTAREVEGILRRAAAKLPGDDVQDFAVANFGGLARPATLEADPAEGMMLEEGTTALPMLRTSKVMPARQSASPTFAVADMSALDVDFPPPPAPAQRSMAGPIAGLVALVLVLGGGFFVWQGSQAPAPVAGVPLDVPAAPVAPVAPIAVVPAPPDAVGAPIVATSQENPVAAVIPGPVTASPATPKPAKDPAAPVATVAPVAAPVAAPSASAVRLRAAKFVLTGGEGIAVTCGDVSATGGTNALVREFPAGPCSVTVGAQKATITLDSPRQVDCTLSGESLSCR